MTRLLHTRRALASAVAAVAMVLSTSHARAQVAGIAVEPDGSIVIVDFVQHSVLRVDPVTGAVQTLSSATAGSGPSLDEAWGIAVAGDGSLLVTAGIGAQKGVLRVDPSTGDRTTVSDDATGSGPSFLSVSRPIAVGPDGSIFVGDDAHEAPDVDRIIRVDPANGDRSVISDANVGTGPEMRNPAGLAVEPTGSLACVDGLLNAVLRVDPATGDRTVVSDESVGSGRPFGWLQAVAVEEDATLVALDSFREVFCVPLCPHPLCVYCLTNAPTVFRVDPVDGDRTLVSGGGTCLMAGDGTCQTPYFGRRGRGPDLEFPQGIAVESPRSFVVADFDQVVRVDAVRGRRTVLATIAPPAASRSAAARPQRQDRLRRLSSLDARRVHRPQDPGAWLRRAVGTAGEVRGRRPEGLFRRLTPERRRALGERLYAALWQTMRAVLGADHPDTRAAAPTGPGRRPAEE